MIVEVRSYRIKPGRREEFIRLFETRAVPAQRTDGDDPHKACRWLHQHGLPGCYTTPLALMFRN